MTIHEMIQPEQFSSDELTTLCRLLLNVRQGQPTMCRKLVTHVKLPSPPASAVQ